MVGVEGFSVVELEMGREGQHEEPIDRRNRQARIRLGLVAVTECAKPFYGGRGGAHVPVHVYAEPQVAEQE